MALPLPCFDDLSNSDLRSLTHTCGIQAVTTATSRPGVARVWAQVAALLEDESRAREGEAPVFGRLLDFAETENPELRFFSRLLLLLAAGRLDLGDLPCALLALDVATLVLGERGRRQEELKELNRIWELP